MIGYTPAYVINIGGQNVTRTFAPLLMSLEVNDEEGTQSDSATITLDDPGGMIRLPNEGDDVLIALGYLESGVFPMGRFTVDTVKASGWPQQVVIDCKSANMVKGKKQQRTRSSKDKSLKDVLGEVAQRHGRSLKIVGDFSGLKPPSWHQDGESDLHFVNRLGQMLDANASWKGGQLIFVKKGQSPPGTVHITRSDLIEGSGYELTHKGRAKHKNAEGNHWDRKKVSREKSKEGSGSGTATSGVNQYQHGGKDMAKAAAKGKADSNKRDEKNLSLSCIGNPLIMAEFNLITSGIRSGVDGVWRIKKANHSMADGAYGTTIEAELPK